MWSVSIGGRAMGNEPSGRQSSADGGGLLCGSHPFRAPVAAASRRCCPAPGDCFSACASPRAGNTLPFLPPRSARPDESRDPVRFLLCPLSLCAGRRPPPAGRAGLAAHGSNRRRLAVHRAPALACLLLPPQARCAGIARVRSVPCRGAGRRRRKPSGRADVDDRVHRLPPPGARHNGLRDVPPLAGPGP